jgi:formate C-acetyltransferase
MNERIKRLADEVLIKNTYPPITPVTYKPESMLLPECQTIAVKLGEYLAGQLVKITDDECLVGKMHFDDSVTSEYYSGAGHKHFQELCSAYYLKPIGNLCYVDWIHSGADLEFVINYGFAGYYEKIAEAKKKHSGDKEKLDFLEGLKLTADALLLWTDRCAEACRLSANLIADQDRKKQLLQLGTICARVPRKPPTTFYEAVQTAYFVFMFIPDSPGRIDQYLYPLYRRDLASGRITRDFAKELIQEYLLMIFGHQTYQNFRSGDNHFCVGGYTPDGKDGFNELSELILEAYTELPIWRPQISFRWTKFTSPERMEYITKLNHKCMNIPMVNDEPRLQYFVNKGVPFEVAANYTTVGCNEIQLQGRGLSNSGTVSNIGRSLALLFAEHGDECRIAETFEDFWELYKKYLLINIDEILEYSDKFSVKRAKDISMIASLLNQGCIENAKCITQGGGLYNWGGGGFNGLICVADSLSIVKQFIYDEKRTTMDTLLAALANNWNGYEELRAEILRDGRFYGNDDDQPDLLVGRIWETAFDYVKDKKNIFGGAYGFGNIVGYHPSNAYFGALLPATPDGRYDGEPFCVGIEQLDAKDHTGLTALLKSASKPDYSRASGTQVLNIKIDKRMASDDEKLKKLAALYQTYFARGGVQLQPTYVSTEELLKAQEQPENYRNLRVRVSGFSGNFTLLSKQIQDDVIRRADHNE